MDFDSSFVCVQLWCDTYRHFLHVFQGVFEWFIFLLENLNGRLPILTKKKKKKRKKKNQTHAWVTSHYLHTHNKMQKSCPICPVRTLIQSALSCSELKGKNTKPELALRNFPCMNLDFMSHQHSSSPQPKSLFRDLQDLNAELGCAVVVVHTEIIQYVVQITSGKLFERIALQAYITSRWKTLNYSIATHGKNLAWFKVTPQSNMCFFLSFPQLNI